MDALQLVLNTVIPVFSIIGLGYILGKKKKIDTKPVIDFLVYITGPALIITSISKSTLNINDFGLIFLAASLVIIIQGILMFFILGLRKSKKKGIYLPTVIGNTGYLGYPIALFAFGTLGLSSAIVYDMTNSLFIFSIGIYIVHHKNAFSEMFKLPLIYAVVFGLLINIFKMPIPNVLFKPLEMIGAVTIPVALILLGYRLTEIRVRDTKKAFMASGFRIAGGFVIGIIIAHLLDLSGTIRNIVILQSAMPSAVMSMILTHKYGSDAELSASIVLISTMFAIITIPLILIFLSLY